MFQEKKVLFYCGLFEHARVRGGQLARAGEKKVLFYCGLFEHARVRGGQLVRAARA